MTHEHVSDVWATPTGSIKVNTVNLDLARRAAGLSQRQLADKAGLSPGHISRILSGESDVTPEAMQKLLAVFGNRITFAEFLATESQRPPSGKPGEGL